MVLLHTRCCVQNSEGRGRGIFALDAIPAHTLIEISPLLYFSKNEYEAHGKYTILDHYTFKCRDGRRALALGLGSIFNHSETPNVSYIIDTSTDSIRFATTRPIISGEELFIFYGHKLWFKPVGSTASVQEGDVMLVETEEDGWGGLSLIETQDTKESWERFVEGDPNEIIPEEELPFTRIRLTPDHEEEEEMSAIRTIPAWVVNIPDPKLITTMLKWLKQSGLETPELGHLKRIRRQGDVSSILLCTSPSPPQLPSDLGLSAPYQLPVPLTAALTPTSLNLKSSLWPTVFAPRRKGEFEGWSRGKVNWAWKAVAMMFQEAARARTKGELPIVAVIPPPYETDCAFSTTFTANDTRKATAHPLRHAVMNLIREVADYRSSNPITSLADEASSAVRIPDNPDTPRNGSHYLLTDTTLFTTHEPCIMCSMALLHSRVKEVVYLIPMEKTGGCGGSVCLSKLEGVNHRFHVLKWKIADIGIEALQVDPSTDS